MPPGRFASASSSTAGSSFSWAAAPAASPYLVDRSCRLRSNPCPRSSRPNPTRLLSRILLCQRRTPRGPPWYTFLPSSSSSRGAVKCYTTNHSSSSRAVVVVKYCTTSRSSSNSLLLLWLARSTIAPLLPRPRTKSINKISFLTHFHLCTVFLDFLS